MAGAEANGPTLEAGAMREKVERVVDGRPVDVDTDDVGEPPARGTNALSQNTDESGLHVSALAPLPPPPPHGSTEQVDSPSAFCASLVSGRRSQCFPHAYRCECASFSRELALRIASLIDRVRNDTPFKEKRRRGGSSFAVAPADASGDWTCGSRVGDMSGGRATACTSKEEFALALHAFFVACCASPSAAETGCAAAAAAESASGCVSM